MHIVSVVAPLRVSVQFDPSLEQIGGEVALLHQIPRHRAAICCVAAAVERRKIVRRAGQLALVTLAEPERVFDALFATELFTRVLMDHVVVRGGSLRSTVEQERVGDVLARVDSSTGGVSEPFDIAARSTPSAV